MSPRDRVTVRLWDVRWHGSTFGKHGQGPFATRGQAEACLRAVGWPGDVEEVLCEMDRKRLDRILAKTPKRLSKGQAT